MKFTFTYEQTSWNSFYKPYYLIDNKRVSKDYFSHMTDVCKLKGMKYNPSTLTSKNNRYKAVFYYD